MIHKVYFKTFLIETPREELLKENFQTEIKTLMSKKLKDALKI